MPSEEQVKEIFDLFITEKKKTVSSKDIGHVVRAFRLCPTQKQLQAAIATAGVEVINGEASLKQVAQIVNALSSTKDTNTKTSIYNALKMFDRDGGDMVSMVEIRHILTTLAEKMDREDIDEILRQADVDGFGQINIDDFAATMASAVSQ